MRYNMSLIFRPREFKDADGNIIKIKDLEVTSVRKEEKYEDDPSEKIEFDFDGKLCLAVYDIEYLQEAIEKCWNTYVLKYQNLERMPDDKGDWIRKFLLDHAINNRFLT